MIYAGIDPGLQGALAIIERNEHGPDGVAFHDTQTIQPATGSQRVYNLGWIVQLLEEFQMKPCLAGLEVFHGFPGIGGIAKCKCCKQPLGLGARTVRTMAQGRGIGIWEGALAMAKIATQFVSPQSWKARLLRDMPKGKDSSRIVAMRLYPQAASSLQLKKHVGRADALLIATYVMREYEAEKMEETDDCH